MVAWASASLKAHNTTPIVCTNPHLRTLGGHDHVGLANDQTQTIVSRLRARCGYKPLPAACTVSVIKTALDSFLIGTTTAVVLFQHSRLYAETVVQHGVGAAQGAGTGETDL